MSGIERLAERVEKLESKINTKKRTPVPFFYQYDGESEEEFDRRVEEGLKNCSHDTGKPRCIIFMNKKEP